MDDKVRFVRAITILARSFRTEVDEFLIEGYQMGLDGVPIDQIETAVRKCCGSSKFMPSPVELKEAAGIRDVLSLYRKSPLGKCPICGETFSFPESVRRGYCGKHWRGVLEANGFTEEDERLALEAVHPDKPPQLPRSGRGPERITGGDFDA